MREIKIVSSDEFEERTEIKAKVSVTPDCKLVVEVPANTLVDKVIIKPEECEYGIMYS